MFLFMAQEAQKLEYLSADFLSFLCLFAAKSSKHCGTAALQLESCAATLGQTMLVRPKKLIQRPASTISLPRVRQFLPMDQT
jgi:hypothetical protein